MANIYAAFVEQIFDLPQRKRKSDVHHYSQTDDLGRRLEISEGVFHQETLRNPPPRLKLDSPDNASQSLGHEHAMTTYNAYGNLPHHDVRKAFASIAEGSPDLNHLSRNDLIAELIKRN